MLFAQTRRGNVHIAENEEVHDFLRTARCQLLLRNFSGCVNSCVRGFEVLKTASERGENDEIKSKQMCVSLGVIAVQAFAEQNKWKEVVEFLRNWFGEVWQFPPQLLILCTSLYVKMDKLSTADHLVSEWITSETNYQDEKYCHIVDFYIHRILLPLGGSKKVKDFLNSWSDHCQIPEVRKQMYLEYVQSIEKQEKDNCKPASILCNTINKKTKMRDENTLVNTLNEGPILQSIVRTLQWLRNMFHRYMAHNSFTQLTRLILLLFFLYAVFCKTNSPGLWTKGSAASVFWQGVVQSWKALFAPYYLMPRQS